MGQFSLLTNLLDIMLNIKEMGHNVKYGPIFYFSYCECFWIIFIDAGASSTHQASQHGSERQLDKQTQFLFGFHLETIAWTLMRRFNEAHFMYCNGP
jgi:hypothetical protein